MIEPILQHLRTLVKLQEQILNCLNLQQEGQKIDTADWLDNTDVKQWLKISDATLYRLRKAQLITGKKIGKKWFYRKSDIVLKKGL